MANQYAGHAAVYAIDGTIAYTGKAFVDASTVALSSANAEPQSVSFGHEFQTIEVKSRAGKTVGMASLNESQTVQVTIIVHAGAGGTYATAKNAVKLPAPLALVTLAGFDGTGASLDGTYNYVGGGSISLTSEGYHSISLQLKRFEGVALTPAA